MPKLVHHAPAETVDCLQANREIVKFSLITEIILYKPWQMWSLAVLASFGGHSYHPAYDSYQKQNSIIC